MAAAIDYLPHYTYEDYKEWEGKWELIGGIAYAMAPAPMIEHQRVSNKIARVLDEVLEECKECVALLPVDWKISEDTIVQPDNMVYCGDIENPNYLTKAPKVIFEVISPSTALKDANLKFDLYEREGVLYYILVYPGDRVAKVYRWKDGRYQKVRDSSDESVEFDIGVCKFDFDFGRIW